MPNHGKPVHGPWNFRFVGPALLLVTCGILVLLLAGRYYYLALAYPLFLLALLLFLKRPALAYFLIVFLIPFGGYRKVETAFFVINVPWVIALLLVGILAVGDLRERRLLRRLDSNLWRWFLPFLAVCLASAILSEYRRMSMTHIMYLLAAYAFVAFGILLITSRDLVRTIPVLIIGSVSASSLLAVIGFALQIPAFTAQVEGTSLRGSGSAREANNMSLMIIFALPLILHHVFYAASKRGRAFALVLLVLNMAALVSTLSRGGFVVFLLLCLLLAVEYAGRLRPRHMGFLLLALIAAVALTATTVPGSYWARQKTLLEGTRADKAMARRASYLTVGWDLVRKNPLLGSGPGTFRDYYSRTPQAFQFAPRGAEADSSKYRRYAHNTYLEVAVGAGLLGLALYLGMLFQCLRDFSRARRELLEDGERKEAFLVASYRIAFVAVAVYLLLFSDMYHKYLLLSLSLSQAAVLAARTKADEPPGGRSALTA